MSVFLLIRVIRVIRIISVIKYYKMKITNVTATVLRLPQISSAADGTQDDLIITLETDE